MIKEGCEHLYALLILLIFYENKNHKKTNLSLDNKNKKNGGKYNYEINVFFLK